MRVHKVMDDELLRSVLVVEEHKRMVNADFPLAHRVVCNCPHEPVVIGPCFLEYIFLLRHACLQLRYHMGPVCFPLDLLNKNLLEDSFLVFQAD